MKNKRNYRNLWLVLLLLPATGQATEARRLTYGETAKPATRDPYTGHEASAARMADLLFNSLTTTTSSGKRIPGLASHWTVESNGTSVLFKLRRDVYWHPPAGSSKPTHKLSADDVATTVRIIKAKGSQIPNQERFQAIAATEVVDPHTVRIRLARAMTDPLRVMGFKILPAHILASTPALRRDSKFASMPVGTGPYRLLKVNDHGEVVLEAFNRYFAGKPTIPTIVMKSYADQSVMAQSLMFNSLDLITWVSPRDLSEIMGDRNLGVIPYDALSFSFFAMNTSRGILGDKRVRRAISHSVNRQEMLNAFFQGKGSLISGPFPPTSWAYNLNVTPVSYDPARAAKLFAEAGLSHKGGKLLDKTGKPVRIVFAVPLSGESEMIKRISLAFQGYLQKAGIAVELQFMDWNVWKNRVLRDHDYDVTIASWSFDDASNITSLFHSSSAKPWGNNFVLYRNTQVDSLLTEAASTNDFEKRRVIYKKLHAMLADEAPYTFLWTLMHHAAHNMKVSGVKVEPWSFFRHVATWQIKDKPR